MRLLNRTEKAEPLPQGMTEVVADLRRTQSRQVCLELVYQTLIHRYRGYRIKIYLRFYEILMSRPSTLWSQSSLNCISLNKLLRIMLEESGLFTNQDIKTAWTNIWYFSAHQYLKVQVEAGKWVDVDVWGRAYGIPLGEHAHGFNTSVWASS